MLSGRQAYNVQQTRAVIPRARLSQSGPTPTVINPRNPPGGVMLQPGLSLQSPTNLPMGTMGPFSPPGSGVNSPTTMQQQQQPGDNPYVLRPHNRMDFSNDAKQIFSSYMMYQDDYYQISNNNNGGGNGPTVNQCSNCYLTFLAWILVILTFPLFFSLYFNFVYEYERAIIFRLGEIQTDDRSPDAGTTGVFFKLPCVETFKKVDMRTTCLNFPPQETLTRDSVFIRVDVVIYYRIFNPVLSITEVDDVRASINLLAQAVIRNLISTKLFNELTLRRDFLAEEFRCLLQGGTSTWGVRIEKVLIKRFDLNAEMQRAISSEAEAIREGRAKLITADGERNTARALKEAADIISMSPVALQLRYLQTLTKMGGNPGDKTVVLPLPVDLFGGSSSQGGNPFVRSLLGGGRTTAPMSQGVQAGSLVM